MIRIRIHPIFQATIHTLHPDWFPGPLRHSLAGRALDAGLWSLEALDIREFSTDKHRTVDDTPCGGGAGMVLKPDVVDAALMSAADRPGPLVCLTPRGEPLTQQRVEEIASGPGVRLLCGRFEAIDQRVIDKHAPLELSVGDYVLSGGEMAAFTLLDAVIRLLPGVMGNGASGEDESFSAGLLEYPQYTRPVIWEDRSVPEVLLSGHHKKISAWRQSQAEIITQERRPDLWARYRRDEDKKDHDQ